MGARPGHFSISRAVVDDRFADVGCGERQRSDAHAFRGATSPRATVCFSPSPTASIGSNLNPITVVSSSEIEYTQFNDQSDAGAWQVQVESPDGTLSNAELFAVVTTAEPSLTSVSPTLVAASDSDQTLTLSGSNFAAGYSLLFTFPDGTTGSNLIPITVVSTARSSTRSSTIRATRALGKSRSRAWTGPCSMSSCSRR